MVKKKKQREQPAAPAAITSDNNTAVSFPAFMRPATRY